MNQKNNKWPEEYLHFHGLTPEERLELRKSFYSRYGYAIDQGFGYGNSELAFLSWEIERGALNDLEQVTKGSPWWRKVNSVFLIYSEWAGACYAEDPDYESHDHCVNMWLEYLRHPTDQTWYRAHNSSIITGYLDAVEEAWQEEKAERVFMNEVLYRLLFAQSMVESPDWMEELAADPRLPSVDLLVHMDHFYPDHYPLSKKDIEHVLHKGYCLQEDAVKVLDEVIILPHIDRMYEDAAKWTGIPELTSLARDGKAVYALNHD
jgi:hypothetical protein